MIPTWLRPILEAKGVLHSDGVSRTARAGTCRDCGALVLRGLDADVLAFAVTVDPCPLNEQGELIALIHGLRTFEIGGLRRQRLDYRRADHIAARPAAAHKRRVVLAEHRCGFIIPSEGHREMRDNENADSGRIPF